MLQPKAGRLNSHLFKILILLPNDVHHEAYKCYHRLQVFHIDINRSYLRGREQNLSCGRDYTS